MPCTACDTKAGNTFTYSSAEPGTAPLGTDTDCVTSPAFNAPEWLSGNAFPSGITRTLRATASDFTEPMACTVNVCKPTSLTRTGKLTPETCPGSSVTLVLV